MTPSLTRRLLRSSAMTGTTARWLRPEPQRLARDLATLGPVLCLWSEPPQTASLASHRLLVAAPELQVLARPGFLCHACAVTADGPREWLTACDDAGVPRLQLHLLPDTDYLAWDGLVATAPELPSLGPPPSLRGSRARRLRFTLQPLGPCALLSVRNAGPAGALSWQTARSLAHGEGARLID
ncbi:hypothetical protein [Dyella sp.]|jgi:hypothetical protein|uniref:hypothetical protein n=1 Tax=Dyella sp. TaxID=1869338 RepID=UPI002D77A60D|nr:hypothetical protein [Dyella sp.]HET6431732.1 hypothetical protein [Dyella sp.]